MAPERDNEQREREPSWGSGTEWLACCRRKERQLLNQRHRAMVLYLREALISVPGVAAFSAAVRVVGGVMPPPPPPARPSCP